MPRISRSGLLPLAFSTAVRALHARGPYILGDEADGQSHLSVDLGGTTVSRETRVLPGEVEVVTRPIAVATMSFRIEAVEQPGWMPLLIAELEVVAEPSGVEVALDGEYRVPGSIAGLVLDRLLLHRVAEASIDRLFEGILSRLRLLGAQMDALTGIPS